MIGFESVKALRMSVALEPKMSKRRSVTICSVEVTTYKEAVNELGEQT